MGLYSAVKASKAGRLETVGFLAHSRWPGGLQCPNPSSLSDLPKDNALLPYLSIIITDKSASVGPSLVKSATTGNSSIMTMSDVETVVVHSGVEGLPGYSHTLETTPLALY